LQSLQIVRQARNKKVRPSWTSAPMRVGPHQSRTPDRRSISSHISPSAMAQKLIERLSRWQRKA